MSILDNEGHDPLGFGNILRRTDAQDLADLKADNVKLRAALVCIGILNASGGRPDPEIDRVIRECTSLHKTQRSPKEG